MNMRFEDIAKHADITGRHSYPGYAHDVTQFKNAPTNEQLRSLIFDARVEAQRLRADHSETGPRREPTWYLDWDGQRHDVPGAVLPAEAVRRRITWKRPLVSNAILPLTVDEPPGAVPDDCFAGLRPRCPRRGR